jgi:hypothetical protein
MSSGCKCGCKGEHGGSSAMELLKERFVKGEIEKAEFDEKRAVIAEPRDEASAQVSKKGCC